MLDPNDLEIVFAEKMTLVGHIDTDSGGLLLTDSLWAEQLPNVAQRKFNRDMGIKSQRIPVYTTTQGGKRYLLIGLDEGESLIKNKETVTVEGDKKEGE